MSQADELLATLSVTGDETTTLGTMVLGSDSLSDDNVTIGFDRYMIVPETLKKVAVQYDHEIETVTFDCPRYWDDHDLSTMRIYVNYIRSDGVLGSRLCDNVVVDETNDNIIHFDWTVSGHVTEVSGGITFLVCVKNVDSDGNEENIWHSEINSDMYVSPGMKCQETILRRYPDIITQLLYRMDQSEAIVEAAREAESGALDAKAAIENMTVSAEALVMGEGAKVQKTVEDNVVNLHFGLPKGDTGRGIISIIRTSGDGSAGTTDVYTITFSDGTATTFNVYNGADGLSAADAMIKSIYDSENRNRDIFQYVDDVVGGVDVSEQIATHNNATDAHADIRKAVSDLQSNLESDISDIQSDLTSHDHDSRYYTEAEVNTLLAAKEPSHVASSSAPSNTSALWLDTTNGVLKYHNGSAWVAVGAVFG